MTQLPTHTAKKLGLVVDLDTCVGCQACVTACKGWNDQGSGLSDQNPYGADPSGTFLNRVHSYQVQPAEGPSQIINFPRSCLHCEDAPCVTVCPTGASYKRAEDGIVLVNEDARVGIHFARAVRTGPGAQTAADAGGLIHQNDAILGAFVAGPGLVCIARMRPASRSARPGPATNAPRMASFW